MGAECGRGSRGSRRGSWSIPRARRFARGSGPGSSSTARPNRSRWKWSRPTAPRPFTGRARGRSGRPMCGGGWCERRGVPLGGLANGSDCTRLSSSSSPATTTRRRDEWRRNVRKTGRAPNSEPRAGVSRPSLELAGARRKRKTERHDGAARGGHRPIPGELAAGRPLLEGEAWLGNVGGRIAATRPDGVIGPSRLHVGPTRGGALGAASGATRRPSAVAGFSGRSCRE